MYPRQEGFTIPRGECVEFGGMGWLTGKAGAPST